MKVLMVFLAACALSVASPRPETTYTDKWDNIDVEEILESQRLLKSYVDCLLERGRCSPDAKTLRETLPDALEHECSKCTAKQKEKSEVVIKFLVNKRKELWDELSVKYDPDHKFYEKYLERSESKA